MTVSFVPLLGLDMSIPIFAELDALQERLTLTFGVIVTSITLSKNPLPSTTSSYH